MIGRKDDPAFLYFPTNYRWSMGLLICLSAAPWTRARPPYLLETSLPSVFAVRDVRGGNIKRVASAVGEGSIAIAFVHQVLHE